MTVLPLPQSLLLKPNEHSCQETVSIQEQKAVDLPGLAWQHTARILLGAAFGASLLLTALTPGTRTVFRGTKNGFTFTFTTSGFGVLLRTF